MTGFRAASHNGPLVHFLIGNVNSERTLISQLLYQACHLPRPPNRTAISYPPQHEPEQTTSRIALTQMLRRHAEKDTVGAKMETSVPISGPESPAQRQVEKPVNHSCSIMPSSNEPESPALSSQMKRHVILTYKAHDKDILYRELQQNYPNERWFDSYNSFDKKLRRSKGKSKDTKKILLADLPILGAVENGDPHLIGLQEAVQDTISYLLDIEAEWNPVTAIPNQPQGCSSPLWDGQLWLGGIKDSGNREGVLEEHGISAVVSIHPKDWLAEEMWKNLFAQWDGDPNSLQPGWTHDKSMGQYLMELEDNSSSDLLAYFEKAFNFMDYYLLRGENVLVHCKMGQSRSASLVLGYMVSRYYKLGMHLAGEPQSQQKASQNFERPQNVLKRFTNEISMAPDEPNRTAPRTTTSKRRGINTEKFESQLLQHLEMLSQGQNSQPTGVESNNQLKPKDNKTGGGIIKEAILVLCFMHDLRPTEEILRYWSPGKKPCPHFWIEASKDKSGKNDIDDRDHLASVDEFFSSHLRQ